MVAMSEQERQDVDPGPTAATSSTGSGIGENTWAMVTHLAALSGLFTAVGFLLGPLIAWLIKKDQLPAVDRHGKEAIKFQLSMFLYSVGLGLIGGVLTVVLIGFVILAFVGIAYTVMVVVFPIIAGLKANEGNFYHYPMTIRFLK